MPIETEAGEDRGLRNGSGVNLGIRSPVRRRGRRKHSGPPVVVGLTGGIGMGKSTAASLFRRLRVPVFDADREVHRLGARGGAAVVPIGALLPDVVVEGAIDRARLRDRVSRSPDLLRAVERIIHPLVRRARDRALLRARLARLPVLVLDVPLLFETEGDRDCDLTIVVSAPASVQRARLRRRGRMSDAELNRLIGRQMPDRLKRRLADVIVPTGLGRGESARRLRRLLGTVRACGL